MNIERSRKWMVIGLAAGLAGALAPQASRAEENCSSHRQLLEQALPADLKDAARAMIAAQPAAGQLTEAFNPRVIGGVLGDRLRPDKTQCRFGGKKKDTRLIECVWTSRAGSVLEVDLARGDISYVNRIRSRWSDEENQIKPEVAIDALKQVASGLGVPTSEWREPTARNVMAGVSGVPGSNGSDAGTTIRRAWVAASATRQIGGFPVLGSAVYAAINAAGDVARIQIDWPELRLAEGVSDADALTRQEILDRGLEALGAEISCDNLSEVHAVAVLAPAALLPAGAPDDDDVEQSTEDQGRVATSPDYVPALLVYAFAPETQEGEGKITSPAREFVLPLVETIDG
jgi:hypothetical protein